MPTINDRSFLADVTLPKDAGVKKEEPTPLNSVWLKLLYDSPRTSSVGRSPCSLKTFDSAISQLLMPGKLRTLRPNGEKVSSVGAEHTVGSNQRLAVRSPNPMKGLPLVAGRWREPGAPTPAMSRPSCGFSGSPLWKVLTPDNCHPPKTWLAMPAPCFSQGSSYV